MKNNLQKKKKKPGQNCLLAEIHIFAIKLFKEQLAKFLSLLWIMQRCFTH